MPDILHRVGINSKPKKVFEALSTIEGLCHWWVIETTGDTKQGGIINFGICEMKVATAHNSSSNAAPFFGDRLDVMHLSAIYRKLK
jgi:uncharacterized protein YndB with AHSA1/START domain